MTPDAAGSVTVGIGGATATVSWPAGTVQTGATLTVNAIPNTGDAVTFATGGIAVSVTVKGNNGKNVTQFAKPLDLEFDGAPSSARPPIPERRDLDREPEADQPADAPRRLARRLVPEWQTTTSSPGMRRSSRPPSQHASKLVPALLGSATRSPRS